MTDLILTVLKRLGVEKYRLLEKTTASTELFFVKKALDLRRVKDVHVCQVTLFCPFEYEGRQMLGQSTALIHPGMDMAAVERSLSEAYRAAGFVKNPDYALPDPILAPFKADQSSLEGREQADIAFRMTEALYQPDVRKTAFINSAELFIEKTVTRILSSEGTELSYGKNTVKGEFVVQCKTQQDVEQYRSFRYDDLDTEALKAKVTEALDAVEARAAAAASPVKGCYDVLLTGEHVRTVLGYYLFRAGASSVYAKYSNFAVGQSAQGEGITGEKLNLTLTAREPYSEEGVALRDRQLIKDGTLCCLFGNTRFCRYLGIEPTGVYDSVRLDNGTKPLAELRKGRVLEPVSFSDFQMDEFSGHFSGEIRLAYLYEDGKRSILTGGSINGNLLECQNALTFSLERCKDTGYEGPFALLAPKVAVAGRTE